LLGKRLEYFIYKEIDKQEGITEKAVIFSILSVLKTIKIK